MLSNSDVCEGIVYASSIWAIVLVKNYFYQA